MTSKHTAGEWKSEVIGTNSGEWLSIYVDDPNVDGEKHELFESEIVRTAVGKRNTLKPKFRDCINADEIRANVALAKAAPDMLTALKNIHAEAKSWHAFHHGDSIVQCDTICACLPELERAIAKAESK